MSNDYQVGYGRPPKGTRFKPGQSGNPRGRPKGTKNLATDLAEELRKPVRVREGDKSRKISKQRAMVIGMTNKGLHGDLRAIANTFNLMIQLCQGTPQMVLERDLSPDDHAVLDGLEQRLLEADNIRVVEIPAPEDTVESQSNDGEESIDLDGGSNPDGS
jgi:hypothetical protein